MDPTLFDIGQTEQDLLMINSEVIGDFDTSISLVPGMYGIQWSGGGNNGTFVLEAVAP